MYKPAKPKETTSQQQIKDVKLTMKKQDSVETATSEKVPTFTILTQDQKNPLLI